MDKKTAVRLGEYLRRNRQARRRSLRSLAADAGVDQAQIRRLEQGTVASPRPEVLQRIAVSLGIPTVQLLSLAGYPLVETLPEFTPYLRSKYNLSDSAVDEMNEFFSQLAKRHGVRGPTDHEDEQ